MFHFIRAFFSSLFMKPFGRFLLIILCAVIVQLILFSQKNLFHPDDFFTYMMANGEKGTFSPEYDENFYNKAWGGDYFQALVTQRGNSSFSLMWKNLPRDNHMPIYFVLLRGICSFFEPVFSITPAVILNVLALIFLLFGFYALLKRIFKDEEIAVAGTFWFAFSYTVLSLEVYIRMYLLWMVFIVWLINFMIAFLEDEKNKSLIFVGLFSVLQILTHFYGFVFEFSLALSGFLMLWGSSFKHKIKKIVAFTATVLLSVLSAFLIYPGMLKTIRFGDRGAQTTGILHEWFTHPYQVFLGQFELLKEALYFDWKWLLGVMAISLLLCLIKKSDMEKRYRLIMGFLMLLILLYMAIVMAVMPEILHYSLRYFAVILPFVFILLLFVWLVLGKLFGFHRYLIILSILIVGGVNAINHALYQDSPFYFRGTNEHKKMENMVKASDIWYGLTGGPKGGTWNTFYILDKLATADTFWSLVNFDDKNFIEFSIAEQGRKKYAYLFLGKEAADVKSDVIHWIKKTTNRKAYYLFTIENKFPNTEAFEASVFLVAPY